ncbi:MAG: two pore domain potassium channel family protein [Caldilineaceae bacterium]|nr:two pore domain potassium channel family protein [Caldilineaceae bacterium]
MEEPKRLSPGELTERLALLEEPTYELAAPERQALLAEILAKHQRDRTNGQVHAEEHNLPAKLRRAFLLLVRTEPELLNDEPVAHFLANEIKPEDFDTLQWESPEHMIEFCEALYGIRFPTEELARAIRQHVSLLVRQALQQYEQQDDWESLYQLMRIAPMSLMLHDAELLRLRHLAHAYEIRRIRRNRWWLYAYLMIQVLLVVVVFPYLFINAENGAIQRQVEELANVNLGDEGYRLFSYLDGLYWAVITAGSIGYGDITPYTAIGKVMAGILGTMGVITAGVIAGLVLKWITPRQLD